MEFQKFVKRQKRLLVSFLNALYVYSILLASHAGVLY